MKFLIDECLTVELAEEAHAAGFEAYHLVHVGKAAWKDWNICAYAEEHGFTLVTNNAADFLRIYRQRQRHPGLVIIIPSVPVKAQRGLFRRALTALRDTADLVNKVLEVDIFDGRTVLRFYDLPGMQRHRPFTYPAALFPAILPKTPPAIRPVPLA